MLRIGYVRLRDAEEDTPVLKAAGCHVVRAEDVDGGAIAVNSILDFIGPGDQLVVARLDRLALGGRGLLEILDRLEARGATLSVLEPALVTEGEQGRTLRAVVEAVAAMEAAGPRRRRPAAGADEIFALQRAGIGPVEIARRLGVSRMTVWRKLKAIETADA